MYISVCVYVVSTWGADVIARTPHHMACRRVHTYHKNITLARVDVASKAAVCVTTCNR